MTSPRILVVVNGPPWSNWTMSGVSKGICTELMRRGYLYGAVCPEWISHRHFNKPGLSYGLEEWIRLQKHKAFGKTRISWTAEGQGPMAKVLRSCPAGTPVIYTYVNPEFDPTFDLRRFRWIGLSLDDVIKHTSYGWKDMPKGEYEKHYESQYRTIQACEALFTHSSYAADSVSRDFNFPRDRIYPIGTGPALEFRSSVNTKIGRYEGKKILFVGRDWQRKGGDLLFDAFKIVKSRIPEATLTIAGPDRPPVSGDGIIFRGSFNKNKRRDREQLRQLFLESAVFCVPSVCETWGLVYIEAAQSGLPIAGTTEWAMPDIVVNGKTGFLSKDRSAEGLADAIYAILANAEKMRSMGKAAIQHVIDVLDWPHVVDRILACISPESLNGKSPKWLPGDYRTTNSKEIVDHS